MVAGCTAVTSAAPHHAGPSRSPGPARSSGRSSLAAPASPAPKPKPAVIPASVVVSSFRAADGSVITLGEFRGAATFRLHAGSEDPGYPALSSLRAGPTVTGGPRPAAPGRPVPGRLDQGLHNGPGATVTTAPARLPIPFPVRTARQRSRYGCAECRGDERAVPRLRSRGGDPAQDLAVRDEEPSVIAGRPPQPGPRQALQVRPTGPAVLDDAVSQRRLGQPARRVHSRGHRRG